MQDPDYFNALCTNKLPGLLGIVVTGVSNTEVRAEIEVKESHMAPNGFLHAGSVVTLADTSCGNGCIANLPEGASGFTTIELKSNHLERPVTVLLSVLLLQFTWVEPRKFGMRSLVISNRVKRLLYFVALK